MIGWLLRRRFSPVMLLLIGPLLAGCGGSDDDELTRYGISGTVKFEDKLLDQGFIRFAPEGQGVSGGAEIKQGVYEISEAKGLPAGKYKVEITSTDEGQKAAEPVPGESNVLSVDRIPAKYNAETELSITITPDGERTFDFDLE
jgi:hypothetical protein